MKRYMSYINNSNLSGAILSGVCRGRLSEGFDFIDRMARAVFIIGIPHLNCKDTKVIFKKHYLDNKIRTQGK